MKIFIHEWATTIGELKCSPARDRPLTLTFKDSPKVHLDNHVTKQGIKAYWGILNRLINKKKALNIPPLLENGISVTNVQIKADSLNEYFVQQCSTISNSSTLPNLQPMCNAPLQSPDIDREKVTKLICALDTTKAHGCDDMSISMI